MPERGIERPLVPRKTPSESPWKRGWTPDGQPIPILDPRRWEREAVPQITPPERVRV